jgi:hypothetical protein
MHPIAERHANDKVFVRSLNTPSPRSDKGIDGLFEAIDDFARACDSADEELSKTYLNHNLNSNIDWNL